MDLPDYGAALRTIAKGNVSGGRLLERLVWVLLLVGCLNQAQADELTRNVIDGTTPPGIEPGAPTGSYALTGFDNVNLFNGNLNFRLPLLAVGGRGEASYTITLPIEQHWSIEEHIQCSTTLNGGAPGCGPPTHFVQPAWWSGPEGIYGAGMVIGRNARRFQTCDQQGTIILDSTLLRLTFIEPDGTEHELRDTLTDGVPGEQTTWTCAGGGPGPGSDRGREFAARDGSNITFVSDTDLRDDTAGLDVLPSGQLLFRNGTRYRIDQGSVTWIRDRNGNEVRFDYERPLGTTQGRGRVKKIADPLSRIPVGPEAAGRMLTITYPPLGTPLPNIEQIQFFGFGGASRTITVRRDYLGTVLCGPPFCSQAYSLTNINLMFPELIVQDTSQYNPPVVTSVQLPNGTSYEFRYNNFGELVAVKLPTGGTFEYDWGTGSNFPSGTYGSKVVLRRVKQRRVYDNGVLKSRTIFDAPTSDVIGPQVVTVRHQDVAGNNLAQERHHFHGWPHASADIEPIQYSKWRDGREHEVESLNAAGNTALRRETTIWAQRKCPPASLGPCSEDSIIPGDGSLPNDPRIIETRVILGTSQSSRQTYAYSPDSFNNQIDVEEFDFGGVTPTRRTHTDYEAGSEFTALDPNFPGLSAYLRSLQKRQTTRGASGQVEADIQYFYDETSPIGQAPGVGYTSRGTVKRGNVTRVSRWLNTTGQWLDTRHTYDPAGNITETVNPRGHPTQYSYDDRYCGPQPPGPTFAFRTTITNAEGHIVRAQYDYNLGRPCQFTDANNVSNQYTYADSLDRLTEAVVAQGQAEPATTTFTYADAPPNPQVTTKRDQLGPDQALIAHTIFDSLGRSIKTRQMEGASQIDVDQEYDALGRVFRISNPYRPGDQIPRTITQFDELSRVTNVIHQDGAETKTQYHSDEAVTTDPAGNRMYKRTDALGRLREVVEHPSCASWETNCPLTAALNYVTSYEYDARDNLTQVMQSGQVRSFTYDSLNRLKSASNPESGTTLYDYDPNGNLSTKTDARIVITTFTYDKIDRIERKTYSDGTPTADYCYDGEIFDTTLQRCVPLTIPYSVGRLTEVHSTASVNRILAYDPLGRVLNASQITDGTPYSSAYQYNRDGTLKQQTYPSGRVVSFAYDAAGRVSGATPAAYASSIQYAAHGAIKQMSVGGRVEQSCFNERLQPLALRLGTGTTTDCAFGASDLLHLAYGYTVTVPTNVPNNGNIRTQTITTPKISGGTLVLSQSYDYDRVNRISSASEGPEVSPIWSRTYEYGPHGNRTVGVNTGLPRSFLTLQPGSFDAASNRVTAASGCNGSNMTSYDWCYDAAGNLTKNKLSETFAYDAENRQVAYCRLDPAGCPAVQGSSRTLYFYDGDGRRVKRISETGKVTIFVYDTLGNLSAEYSQESYSGPTGTLYRTVDHLGSTRLVTNQSGVVARHDYTPFGEEIPNTLGERSTVAGYGAEAGIRQKFTGKERDAESGLDWFRTRYLSSSQGRFTSPDRLFADQDPYDAQSWNLYSYVRNNPLKFIDETGEAIKYASQKLETYSNTMRVRSPTYNAALKGFEGPGAPDITFQIGNAGVDADAVSKAIGLASTSIAPGSTIYGTPDNPNAVIQVPEELKAVTVTIDTSIAKDGSQVRSTLAHEVGHANDARTNTAQYQSDSQRTKQTNGSTPHDQRPEEKRANDFRKRVEKERGQFGKQNKQQNKQLEEAEKRRIKELERLGVR